MRVSRTPSSGSAKDEQRKPFYIRTRGGAGSSEVSADMSLPMTWAVEDFKLDVFWSDEAALVEDGFSDEPVVPQAASGQGRVGNASQGAPKWMTCRCGCRPLPAGPKVPPAPSGEAVVRQAAAPLPPAAPTVQLAPGWTPASCDAVALEAPPPLAVPPTALAAGDARPGQGIPADKVTLPPSLWSVGSLEHATGKCTPCFYIHKGSPCKYGTECKYCHCSHPRNALARPSKDQRQEVKAVVRKLLMSQPSGDLDTLVEKSCSKLRYSDAVLSRYAEQVVRSLFRDQRADATPR